MVSSVSDYYDPVIERRFTDQEIETIGRVPLSYRGSRSATWVVAASVATASHRMRQMADFRCDGTADNVEIQAAIDALPT